MDKYSRQRGIVTQDILADAEIVLHGTGRALPYALQCLALLGVATRHGRIQLLAGSRPVTEDDLACQFLLQRDDLGMPIADALVHRVTEIDATIDISVAHGAGRGLGIAMPDVADQGAGKAIEGPVSVWGYVLATSVYVGPGPLRAQPPPDRNVLTAALAAVCGGLVVQAALAQLGAIIDGPTVLASWFEEHFWITYPRIGKHARSAIEGGTPWPTLYGVLERASGEADARLEFFADGEQADPRVVTVVDDDAVVVAARRHLGSVPQAAARSRRQAPRPVAAVLWSPIEGPVLDGDRVIDETPPLPAGLPPSGIVMCGAGALGSWASAVLAASRLPGLGLCVVDMDDAVETHNLSRQVLFGEGDVGLPKAQRAAERLRMIDPELRVSALHLQIEKDSIDELTGTNTQSLIVDEEIARAREAHQASLDALADALRQCAAILSCPDNHQTRWTLNVIAERLGVPLINGAVEGFTGRVHVCDPADNGMCLVCWLGQYIAHDPKRRSCTDLVGAEPVPAIVTSAAIVGAAQAAALIADLAGVQATIRRYHVLDGKAGTLEGHRASDRDPLDCPAHLWEPAPELGPAPGRAR
jgi:molybdopterin/thiamine biosynthesis adenylyltransferase